MFTASVCHVGGWQLAVLSENLSIKIGMSGAKTMVLKLFLSFRGRLLAMKEA